MAKKNARLSTTSKKIRYVLNNESGVHIYMSGPREIRKARVALEKANQEKLRALSCATAQRIAESALEEGVSVGDALADLQQFAYHDTEDVQQGDNGMDLECSDNEDSIELQASGEARRRAMAKLYGWSHKHGRRNERTRFHRNRSMHESWASQLPLLAQAYLRWKHGSHVTTAEEQLGTQPVHVFHVTAVKTNGYERQYNIQQCDSEEANVALIRVGLLGCSPKQPTVAISLKTLELYHQIRRRQSSFSTQAMAKVICALNNVTYLQVFRDQLSVAFDAYLDILRHIRKSVTTALGRDLPDWRMRYACPSCGNTLANEPKLEPARIHAMDGNNSQKRLDGAGRADERVFDSVYHIPPSEVDRFKDDVRLKPGKQTKAPPGHTQSHIEEEGLDHQLQVQCADNWKAAGNISEETIKVFEQTGIFIAACRHGIVETLVEMRRSGELAKYALATVNRIVDVFGDQQAIGHDIACSFRTTLANSSIGTKAEAHQVMLAVNAFHGHAHNRMCQLRNHPLFIQGLGLEDLETCERIFSASNAVARSVRFSSYFHWLQFLDLHFDQWDQDRYFELSKFLFNNYKQALSIITEYTPQIEVFKAAKRITNEDFEKWRTEEFEYLKNLADEPEGDVLASTYIEALQALAKVEAEYDKCHTHQTEFISYTPADLSTPSASQRQKTSIRSQVAKRTAAQRRVNLALETVETIERHMGIIDRWTEESNEYQSAAVYVRNRQFIRAVEELERLVVQRIWELSKANCAGTGYKQRRHISKAIVRRSAAIKTALDKYNRLAPLQRPPRPALEYSSVVTYGWLGEFELLKYSRYEILDKLWSVPINREVAVKYWKVKGAYDEIRRLNVEIARLHDWVDREDKELLEAFGRFKDSDPLLAAEIQQLYAHRVRVNSVHRRRLRAIYELEGYTGPSPMSVDEDSCMDECVQDILGEEDMLPDEDDGLNDDIVRLEECMERMVV